jgi:hypothetical protein
MRRTGAGRAGDGKNAGKSSPVCETGTPRATTFLVETDPPPDIPMLLARIEALEREVARIPQ